MECQEWQKKYPVRRKKTSSPAGGSHHSAGEYEGYLLQERKFAREEGQEQLVTAADDTDSHNEECRQSTTVGCAPGDGRRRAIQR